jgi:hypothetical protein
MTFPKFIFVMFRVNEQRLKIPRDVFSGMSVVSRRLSFVSVDSLNGKVYEFSRCDVLVVHNAFKLL